MTEGVALGSGALWLGDCLERMRDIPDGSVDMVLCDLPYGTTACKWDQVIPFEALWAHYWRVCKPNAAVVLTASQPFTSALVMSQVDRFRHEVVWQKNCGSNFATLKHNPFKEHENVCVFGRKPTTYNAQMEERSEGGKQFVKNAKYNSKAGGDTIGGKLKHDKANRGELRHPSSVQKFSRQVGLHPTQKPVALFEYLIRTYTNPGELVLDNCAGSGTTAIAAERTGRRWLCIERDPGYYYGAFGRIAGELNK